MNSELQNGIVETEVMAIQKSVELDHSKLNNLDYEHSGHTGFQPAGNYIEDSNYVHTDNNYTTEEKTKLAGLSNYDDTEIKADINSLEGIETAQNEEIVNIKATLSNKADKSEIPDISGKQDLITSANKLDSSLIDDSLSNNKFVTPAEKTAWNNKSDFSGDYNDLTNKPTIPVVPSNVSAFTNDSGYLTNTDFKTINNETIVGSGNIDISGGQATYLGKISEHNTSGTAINLNGLKKGIYTIYADETKLYLKVTNSSNNSEVTGYTVNGTWENSYIWNKIVYLEITTDIPEEGLPTNSSLGYINYMRWGLYGEQENIIKNNNFSMIILASSLFINTASTSQIPYVSPVSATTITGKYTFNVLPESSVTPTTNNQLTNKSYVDSAITSAIGTALGGSY